MPKSLIREVDKRATELGMSRSSFFGLAAARGLTNIPGLRAKTPGKKA